MFHFRALESLNLCGLCAFHCTFLSLRCKNLAYWIISMHTESCRILRVYARTLIELRMQQIMPFGQPSIWRRHTRSNRQTSWMLDTSTELHIPVVPRKAVAEVSKHGTYRRAWLLWITDGKVNPLMDWKVVGVVFFGVITIVEVVTWSVTSPTAAGCSVAYCSCSCSCSVVEL